MLQKSEIKGKVKVYKSDNVDEIWEVVGSREFEYPYTLKMLKLLKTANPLPQTYYFIEEICQDKASSKSLADGKDSEVRFAFFIVYLNRMNLFTYGKAELFMEIQTIGYPCSLSCPGFVTNDLEFLLRFVKTIKGCKLVLNADDNIKVPWMAKGKTLPTCVLKLDGSFDTIDSYIQKLRGPYRRRLKLAAKRLKDIEIRTNPLDADVHKLYLQTYEKSDYKLERLEKEFFESIDADKLVFYLKGIPVGFVLLHIHGKRLDFMFCGMDYKQDVSIPDLYYYMLTQIVRYAIDNRCDEIDFGQTSEKTKLRFGAKLETKYFYAHHTNPLLNLFAILGKRLLEYGDEFPDYHVFK